MAIVTTIPNQNKNDALVALMPVGNVYKAALYTNSANLDKSVTTYSPVNEVVGTGYTAGGKMLSGYALSMDGDVAILDFADPSWSDATISAAGMVIYDSTNGNKIRAVYSFGQVVSSTNGTFTVILPPPAAATALIRIG